MQLDDSIILSEEGYFVSEKMLRLNEIIQDYDPTLSLEWIPTDKRVATDNDAPYRIVHRPFGKPAYVVLFAQETDIPEEILSRIFIADNKHGDVVARMEATNAAYEAFRLKKHQEELEESADIFHFLFTNRSKNYVRMRDRKTGEKIKLDTQRRRI